MTDRMLIQLRLYQVATVELYGGPWAIRRRLPAW